MQVVTNENMAEFIQNRSVPEFVPPKADAKVEVKAVEPAKDESTKVETPPRGEDGKFVKAEESKPDEAAKAAVDEDEDDADLPERVRKQIGKKHRAMREAEEFAREMRADREAERARADRAEAALKAASEKSGPASEKDSKEPNAEDFKTVGEYAEALAEYKVEKKFAERDARQQQEAQQRAATAAQAELNGAITKVMKDIPDYAEVIDASDIDMPPHITVYLATNGEQGVRLGYHLAKHPDEYDRIAKLTPIRAIAELGKLEDRLAKPAKAKEPEAEPTAISRAPSPIKPLEGNSAVVQKDPAKMTIPELREYERAQRLARARR
jgi:hypothetical protein